MWMIKPSLLCDKHLLGEHGELHKFRPSFIKHYSIKVRIFPVVQIEPLQMGRRHDELAKEMLRRGMKHASPYELPPLDHLPAVERYATVNLEVSKKDLCARCEECKSKIEKGG